MFGNIIMNKEMYALSISSYIFFKNLAYISLCFLIGNSHSCCPSFADAMDYTFKLQQKQVPPPQVTSCQVFSHKDNKSAR